MTVSVKSIEHGYQQAADPIASADALVSPLAPEWG